jgi:hypothetical protein
MLSEKFSICYDNVQKLSCVLQMIVKMERQINVVENNFESSIFNEILPSLIWDTFIAINASSARVFFWIRHKSRHFIDFDAPWPKRTSHIFVLQFS